MADNRNKIEKKPRNPAPSPMGSSPRGAGSPDDNETNGYYANAARNFRYAKYFTILLLVIFLLFTITFNRREITIENLQYLMKFISFTNTETSISATKINYASSDKTQLELFIGDLCYLSPQGYALYDSRGNTILSDQTLKYSNPILNVSSKFALCYDLGGNTYSVFNTFAHLASETLDYAITDGDIADDGSFAIGTSTREYRTAVQLYDSDFKLISRVLREDYLCDVKLRPDGSEVVIMTVGSVNGGFMTTVEILELGADKIKYSTTLPGLGYNIYLTESGFAVVSDSDIRFYDASLELLSSLGHGSSLVMTDCSEKYLACVYSTGIVGNNYRVIVYDPTGRTVCEVDVSGKLAALSHDDSGDYIFVLAGSDVTRINLVNRKVGTINVGSGGFDILVQDPSSFLVAMSNYALTCTPADFAEHYIDSNYTDDDASDETTAVTSPAEPSDDTTASDDNTAADETTMTDDTMTSGDTAASNETTSTNETTAGEIAA